MAVLASLLSAKRRRWRSNRPLQEPGRGKPMSDAVTQVPSSPYVSALSTSGLIRQTARQSRSGPDRHLTACQLPACMIGSQTG
jgi:hypothetical protein